MTTSRRALHIGLDVESWSDLRIPERLRAQRTLAAATRRACAEAGLPGDFAQVSGDGVCLVGPDGLDETKVIPEFVRALAAALPELNRPLGDAGVRLRCAMTTGLVVRGDTGFAGHAVVECFRLLDSAPVRDALRNHPEASFALIVSDFLFRDVIGRGLRGLAPESFGTADVAVESFRTRAWLHLPGVRPEPGPEPGPARPGSAAAPLVARADGLIARAEYAEAIEVLEDLLREVADPADPPGAEALLRLGDCHAALGSAELARHTWNFLLLEADPLNVRARLRLGRLECAAGDRASGWAHFREGLDITRSRPGQELHTEALLTALRACGG